MTPLETAARAAGVVRPDVLDLARSDLPPAAAVADLKVRYPTAFQCRFADMTAAEQRVAAKRLLAPEVAQPVAPGKQFADMTVREKEAFERANGISVPWSEIQRRRAKG
jgi:hypothetical protein